MVTARTESTDDLVDLALKKLRAGGEPRKCSNCGQTLNQLDIIMSATFNDDWPICDDCSAKEKVGEQTEQQDEIVICLLCKAQLTPLESMRPELNAGPSSAVCESCYESLTPPTNEPPCNDQQEQLEICTDCGGPMTADEAANSWTGLDGGKICHRCEALY